MSDPHSADPTRAWTPPPEQGGQPRQASGSQGNESDTPWWQQKKRDTPAPQPPSAQPQATPQQYQPPQPQYQQPAYPSPPQQPATYQQPPQQGAYPQYAQPAQYAQPGQYPQQAYAPAPATTSSGSGKRWLIIGGAVLALIVVVVVAAVVLLAVGGSNTQLDVSKAQAGVQQILTDPVNGYGLQNVSDVKCNNGDNPSAGKGDSFTCQVNVNGAKRNVNVVVVDDNGTYEIDRPK
jgi:hypothetical protein